MARTSSKAHALGAHVLRAAVIIAMVAVLVPLTAPSAQAAGVTYWVDSATGSNSDPGTEAQPFKTIAYAASIADSLDTIMVQPGAYNLGTNEVWPVALDGESLVSVGGPGVTALQGDGMHQTLLISGWTAGDRLDGFTISNGGMPATAAAVQVSVTASTPSNPPRIVNCAFSSNHGGSNGGALWATCSAAATLVVEDSTFTANSATSGGAMAASAYGTLVLRGNMFSLNGAIWGGAMNLYAGSTGSILVEGNTFISNAASNSGGAIHWTTGALSTMHTIQNNDFTSNSGPVGGVLYLSSINVAITANEAGANSAGLGGQAGFAYLENADVLAQSNYLAQNTSGLLGSVWTIDPSSTLTEINDTLAANSGSSYVTYAVEAATLAVLNCIYWNETTPVEIAHADSVSYTCSFTSQTGLELAGSTVGAGMVYANPQFDGSNLPALLGTSPCIDTGSPIASSVFDFFGTPVPQDGTYEGTAVADIGCYEAPDPTPTVLAPVYRFYNFTNNTHFFTPSAEEADGVIARYSDVFRFEGIAYYTNLTNNTQPLYRFYNRVSASHFYTASAEEAAHIIATWPHIYSLDGQTYAVNPAPVPNSAPVYRFYNLRNGSHFYTASAEEADMVIATWPSVYRFEGPAFWIGL